MRAFFPIPFLAFAACAPQAGSISGPAAEQLIGLPAVQFSAVLDVAQEVAVGCPDFAYSPTRQSLLTRARAERGVPAAAPGSLGGVGLETDVTRRSFQARYDVVVGQDNTCAAMNAAIAEGSPISALWVPS